MRDPREIMAFGVPGAYDDGVVNPEGKHFGIDQVQSTDAEIARDNRLFLLVQVHRKWRKKNQAGEQPAQPEERIMDQEQKICEQCGKEVATLKKAYGKQVCSTCGIVRGVVKNRPEIVVSMFSEIYGEETAILRAGLLEKTQEEAPEGGRLLISETQITDIALAALRGEGQVVADLLELLRRTK